MITTNELLLALRPLTQSANKGQARLEIINTDGPSGVLYTTPTGRHFLFEPDADDQCVWVVEANQSGVPHDNAGERFARLTAVTPDTALADVVSALLALL